MITVRLLKSNQMEQEIKFMEGANAYLNDQGGVVITDVNDQQIGLFSKNFVYSVIHDDTQIEVIDIDTTPEYMKRAMHAAHT